MAALLAARRTRGNPGRDQPAVPGAPLVLLLQDEEARARCVPVRTVIDGASRSATDTPIWRRPAIAPVTESTDTQPDLDAPRQGERATRHRRHSAEQTPGGTDIVVSFPLTFPCRSTAIAGNKMAPRGARKNTPPATWDPPAGQARREDPRSGQRRWQKPCRQKGTGRAQQGSLRAPPYAGGGTGSWRPRVSCGSTRRGRDRAHTTPLPVAAVAAPPCSRRSRRPPCADPSPRPAMTLGGSAASSARPQRGQLPSRTPCSRNRPEPRKGAERRAGIRNLRPFRIPA